jgi:hypothetical protein
LDADHYTVSVSFQPAIIQFALDGYVPVFNQKRKQDLTTTKNISTTSSESSVHAIGADLHTSRFSAIC